MSSRTLSCLSLCLSCAHSFFRAPSLDRPILSSLSSSTYPTCRSDGTAHARTQRTQRAHRQLGSPTSESDPERSLSVASPVRSASLSEYSASLSVTRSYSLWRRRDIQLGQQPTGRRCCYAGKRNQGRGGRGYDFLRRPLGRGHTLVGNLDERISGYEEDMQVCERAA